MRDEALAIRREIGLERGNDRRKHAAYAMAPNFYCVIYYQTRQGTSPFDWRTLNIDQQTSSMFAHGFYCLNSKTSDPPADGLTYSLPLLSASRLNPIYVARIPAAPFAVANI